MKILVLFFISTVAYGQDQWKNVYTENAWNDRDHWQKASSLIAQLDLKDGSSVADIGCHEGYMTVKLSRSVGTSGRVYAVDIVKEKLDKMKIILEKRDIKNVIPVLADDSDPKLPLNSLDGVIILDTYHEINQYDKVLQHIQQSLRPKGRLVLCEAIAESRRKEPRTAQQSKHELGMSYAIADLKKAGFKVLKAEDPFVDRTKEKGDKMWMIVAEKK